MRKFVFAAFSLLVAATSAASDRATLRPVPDKERVLRNPLSGWTLYLRRNWDEDFWTKENYDAMPAGSDGLTVKESD